MAQLQPKPLMPKATAVWLIENTSLSFEQIADFCGLHSLEIQAIADGEVAVGMIGLDPIGSAQLTKEEITRCESDPAARLRLTQKADLPMPMIRAKGPRYTPVNKRGDKPDAIAFLLKTYPQLSDAQICQLIGTTKDTIKRIRDKSHWNAANIKARDPLFLGLTTQRDLDIALNNAERSPTEVAAVQAQVDYPLADSESSDNDESYKMA